MIFGIINTITKFLFVGLCIDKNANATINFLCVEIKLQLIFVNFLLKYIVSTLVVKVNGRWLCSLKLPKGGAREIGEKELRLERLLAFGSYSIHVSASHFKTGVNRRDINGR